MMLQQDYLETGYLEITVVKAQQIGQRRDEIYKQSLKHLKLSNTVTNMAADFFVLHYTP